MASTLKGRKSLAQDVQDDMDKVKAAAGIGRKKQSGYQLVPKEPTHRMLKALGGDPLILAGSDEEELRIRYARMLEESPTR